MLYRRRGTEHDTFKNGLIPDIDGKTGTSPELRRETLGASGVTKYKRVTASDGRTPSKQAISPLPPSHQVVQGSQMLLDLHDVGALQHRLQVESSDRQHAAGGGGRPPRP